MSDLSFILQPLNKAGINYELKAPFPITTYPWKTQRSQLPKSDIFAGGIYIELAGWMTIYNIAKSYWFANQNFPYYFFDANDETWEPWTDSPCSIKKEQINENSNAALVRSSIFQQIEELKYFINGKHSEVNALSRSRLTRHIQNRFDTFKEWGMEIPKIY
jgi:hypothetical protein